MSDGNIEARRLIQVELEDLELTLTKTRKRLFSISRQKVRLLERIKELEAEIAAIEAALETLGGRVPVEEES